MNTYAVIDTTTTVINIVIWDGQPPWEPGDGQIAVVIPENSSAGIGWTYVDGGFIAPPEPEPDLAG
jgi:hypothetical protein